MRTRELGKSGIQVSEIALGSWLTYAGGVERARAEACTRAAIDLGITFFDGELDRWEQLTRSTDFQKAENESSFRRI